MIRNNALLGLFMPALLGFFGSLQAQIVPNVYLNASGNADGTASRLAYTTGI